MDLILQSLKFGWMGEYSAYQILTEPLSSCLPAGKCRVFSAADDFGFPGVSSRSLRIAGGFGRRVARKLRVPGHAFSPRYRYALPSRSSVESTIRIEKKMVDAVSKAEENVVVHSLYGDSTVDVFMRSKARENCNWIATIHQPPGWWRAIHTKPEMIGEFDSVVTLGRGLAEFASEYIDSRKVYSMRHPVDSNFFAPHEGAFAGDRLNEPRILFAGKWLRDLKTLAESIKILSERNPSFQFDLLVPDSERFCPEFLQLATSDRVSWHSGLSDLEMRSVIQGASVLFMPFIDAVANCAVIEALACGIPVVATDVGDVRDYVTSEWGYLASSGSVEDHVFGVERLLGDEERHRRASRAARSFAIEELSLERTCEELIGIYGGGNSV